MVNLNRCNRSCNTLDNPSGRICVQNKTEDVSLNDFNTITRINESKTLIKHASCESIVYVMVENVIKIKTGIMINVDVSAKIQENIICGKNIIFGMAVHVLVKIVNI